MGELHARGIKLAALAVLALGISAAGAVAYLGLGLVVGVAGLTLGVLLLAYVGRGTVRLAAAA